MKRKNGSRIHGSARYVALLIVAEPSISCQPAFELSDGFVVAHSPEDAGSRIDFSSDQQTSGLSIGAISPPIGPVTGNQPVRIKGTGFRAGIKVEFGSKPASPVEIISDQELLVSLPAHLNGLTPGEKKLGPVVVTVKRGSEAVQGSFTYAAINIEWEPPRQLPADTDTYPGPTLLQINNNADGHGQTGIFIGQEKGALAGVAWRWADGTFDRQTYIYPRPAGVGEEPPGALRAFSFSADPKPDIFLTIDKALYQIFHGTDLHSFFGPKRVFDIKNNGFIAVVKHNADQDMAVVDNAFAYVLSPDGSGALKSTPINKIELASPGLGVVAAKLNHADSWGDLAILGQNDGDGGYVSIFLGQDKRGDFPITPTNYAVGKDPCAIVATDLNVDGIMDLAVATKGDNQIGILFGNGDGTFRSVQHRATGGGTPVALRAADLNGDGYPELVFLNQNENGFAVLRNQGSEGFDLMKFPVADTASEHRDFDLGDVDQDKQVDVVLTSYSKNKVQLVLNKSQSRL